MQLLLHMCCSNCSLYPLKTFLSKGINVVGLWFNPNIHPEDEYQRRLSSLQNLQKVWALDIEYRDHYGLNEFLKDVGNPDSDRCNRCYAIRLDEAARLSKRMGLDGFTTTLLVSPYQKFDAIVLAGKEAARKHSVPFYLEDFRPGYRNSVALSKDLGLYRQKYCGCIYSAHG